MRPRSNYEDGHDHIIDVSSYAGMIKAYKLSWDLCGQFAIEKDPFDFVL